MKIKMLFFVISLSFFFGACNKDKPESDPVLKTKIYKTKQDYFDKVNIWGHFVSAPSMLNIKDSNHIKVIGNDTVYKKRWRLDDGYVMDIVVSEDDYFTDMTFAEIVSYNEKHTDGFGYPLDKIYSRVVDYDPFIEFYVDKSNLFYKRDSSDIEKLNKLIKEGTLKNYLIKTK